ncbi:lipopolysaccharide biosynthesis protein [Halorubrum lacusprofundi]|jgi:O-antigen/teichoic acid export membrane protein|uniref:lipopolysaccharide biosynthesis protein n=1 Tax=Halorubrum lacusprofundi TaxID=2247 RepID=UPI000B5A912F|nr:oligosaccharide flippase family protein [Halorubrum lacusprofundi]MCG1007649.1 oligosaccharide flippase family protein [Halorubrum lacusprofundi]
MNILKATSKLTVVNFINKFLSLGAITLLARELGPKSIGAYFLFESLLVIFRIPADFGFLGAIEKRISEGDASSEFVTMGVILKTIPLLICIGVISMISGQINTYLGSDLASLLIIGLVLREYSEMSIRMLTGELRVGETAVLRLLKQTVWVVTSVVLVYATSLREKALVYGLLLALFVMLVDGWRRTDTPFGPLRLERAKSLWSYAKYNSISTISSVGHNWLDVTVLGIFFGPAAVGIYEIAWRITSGLLILPQAFAETLIPQVSKWHSNNEYDRIESLIPKGLVISLLIPLPALVGLYVLSDGVLVTIFGPEYLGAATALVILAGGRCIEAAHFVIGRTVHGLDRPDLGALIGVITFLANLILNLLLVPLYGVTGASIATVLSFSIGTLILTFKFAQMVDLRLPVKSIGYICIALYVMSVVTTVLRTYLGTGTAARVLIIVGIGAITYFVSIYLLAPLRQELKQTMQTL